MNNTLKQFIESHEGARLISVNADGTLTVAGMYVAAGATEAKEETETIKNTAQAVAAWLGY